MKKLGLVLSILLCVGSHAQAKLNVVSTIGQINDAVINIADDLVNAEGLMGPGVDPHLYKASQSDVRKLSRADIIFYNGLHLEAKMGDLFKKMSGSKVTAAIAENIPEEYLMGSVAYPDLHDPHVWFDLTMWTYAIERIRDTFIQEDAVNEAHYQSRADAYIQKVSELDQYIRNRIKEVPESQRVLVTAHDAFRYFGKAYDFEVKGLQGISTESEAGAKDVMELANFIVERKIKAIFVETSIPERNIRAVQEAVASRGWDVKIGGELFSDALGEAGTEEGTYLGMVKHNIDTIIDALK